MLGAVLLGTASGLRSQIGVASVVVTAEPGRLPGPFGHRGARLGALAAAAGELVVDKLPGVPARTAAGGLAARVVLGGVSGALLASVSGGPVVCSAAIGSGSAVAGAYGGLAVRRRLAARIAPLAAGLAEDGLAVALALSAVAALDRPTGEVPRGNRR
jgi:uncharacterized membrane protein